MPRVTVAPLTAIPTGVLVTVAVVPDVVTAADAVMLVAPAELTSAAFKMIEATPLEFVRAVAEVGVNTTSVLSAAKVTTAFCTSAPLPSLSVAVAVCGAPNVTVLEVKLKVREPEPDGVGVEPVEPAAVSGPVPHP